MNDETLHKTLATFNQTRLQPGFAEAGWENELEKTQEFQLLEFKTIEEMRAQVAGLIQTAPKTSEAFLKWFEELKSNGPGQGDLLFPWLATQASLSQMRWFLTQEMAGEAGFDDLVAMTQVKLPEQSKLELARNYWDEMGRGNREAQHGLLLNLIAKDLQLFPTLQTTVWESLALANVMTALAANRRYTYLSVGALGVIEMTSPARVACVNEGLKRLGVPSPARRYFMLHATLDIRHSESWNKEVIGPLISTEPRTARLIAEGALIRLILGAQCFERYRLEYRI